MDTMDPLDKKYTVENAESFGWSSVSGKLHPERVAHLEKYLVGKEILDVGCGGGGFVDHLSRKGYRVTGLDKFPQFLEIAEKAGFQGTFVQGDVSELPFPDKSFDTAFCFDVLEHVDDVAAMREMARVARKRIIAAVPHQDTIMPPFSLTFAPYRDTTHLRYYTPESLKGLGETVAPAAKVTVFPELFVNFGSIVQQMMRDEHQPLPLPTVRHRFGGKVIENPLLTALARLSPIRKTYRLLFTDPAAYREVPTGLVIVVDLEDA